MRRRTRTAVGDLYHSHRRATQHVTAVLPYLVPCVEHVGTDDSSDEREEGKGRQRVVHYLPHKG